MALPFRQTILVTIVATTVTLGVNLALLGWRGQVLSPSPTVPSSALTGVASAASGQIPVTMRTVAVQPPAVVVLPSGEPNTAPPMATAIPALVVSTPSAQPLVADRNAAGSAMAATGITAPCGTYSLSDVLAAFRRADLLLRDSLFDPAAPGTYQPFPITARVVVDARGVSGQPGLRLDVFVLPDEAQVRVLQGDAGRWALENQREIRVFPYRNVVLVSYGSDPDFAVPYERALVQLP